MVEHTFNTRPQGAGTGGSLCEIKASLVYKEFQTSPNYRMRLSNSKLKG